MKIGGIPILCLGAGVVVGIFIDRWLIMKMY